MKFNPGLAIAPKLLILWFMKPLLYLILYVLHFNFFGAFGQGLVLTFGSCLHQEKDLSLLTNAENQHPDGFIFLGDNVYVDSYDSMKIIKAYQELACNPDFQNLKKSTPLFATWDDHDYGMDDVGKYYPLKDASKRAHVSFFNFSNQSELMSHEGIYQSYFIKYRGKKIQLILLDTRSFRSSLKRIGDWEKKDPYFPYDRLYLPVNHKDSTLLGEAQWAWLRKQLKVKSSLTIIASSIQFATEYNGYETWSNFPLEQQRMYQLIDSLHKEHVVFISGDVHYAELSKDCNATYPIYDLTSSGISESWEFAAPNVNRVEGPVMENNYGLLRIQPWRKQLQFEIHGKEGLRFQRSISLDELEFK